MCRLLLQACIICILTTIFWGCKKSKQEQKQPQNVSAWNFAGKTYTGDIRIFDDNTLLSEHQSNTSNNPDRIFIRFGSLPVSGSFYTVTDTPFFKENQKSMCQITFITSDGLEDFDSTGGGLINVSIAGNQITASFENIALGTIAGSSSDGTRRYTPAGTITGKVIGKWLY